MNTTEQLYQAPESEVSDATKGKKTTLVAKRLTAFSLLKVMFVGMTVGYTALMIGYLILNQFGIFWPEVTLGDISGSAIADTILFGLILAVFQLITVYPFVWFGCLIYSFIKKSKLSVIN